MKSKITLGARLLLGFVFAAGGIMYFAGMAKPPEGLPEALTKFNAGLEASGYFMTLLKVTETACGLLLLSGYFVPLALVVLAPVVLNIFFVNLCMMPQGLPLAIIIGLLLTYLAFFAEPYSSVVKQLFRPKP